MEFCLIDQPKSTFDKSVTRLSWELKFLSLENFGDIEIEEVAVEDGLDTPSNDSNDVIESLAIVSVDPVENVEATIGTESKQIVTGDALCLPSF